MSKNILQSIFFFVGGLKLKIEEVENNNLNFDLF